MDLKPQSDAKDTTTANSAGGDTIDAIGDGKAALNTARVHSVRIVDDADSTKRKEKRDRASIWSSWTNVAVALAVGTALVISAFRSLAIASTAADMAKQSADIAREVKEASLAADKRQADYLARQDALARFAMNDSLLATSERLIRSRAWDHFQVFYAMLKSDMRVKVIKQLDDKSEVPEALIIIIGRPGTKERNDFVNEWLDVTFAVWAQAEAVANDRAMTSSLLERNEGVFELSDTLSDDTGGIYDKWMIDCKRLNNLLPDVEVFRQKYQEHFRKNKKN